MKRLLSALFLALILLAGSSSLNSCRQNPLEAHDTVVRIVHDTIWMTNTAGDTSGDLIANSGFIDLVAGTHDLSNDEMLGWNVYKGSPQFGGGPGSNGAPGYIQMWGNGDPTLGEGITQTLFTPLIAGHTYILSADVRWMNDNLDNYTPYTRFRFTAYNDNGQSETIGTIQTNSVTWKNMAVNAWIAKAQYNHLAITVEDDNVGTNSACWGHIDNVVLVAR